MHYDTHRDADGSFGPYWEPGTKVMYHGCGGYDHQIEKAEETFIPAQILTVKNSKVWRYSSEVSFEEVEGSFNTVMFARVTFLAEQRVMQMRKESKARGNLPLKN